MANDAAGKMSKNVVKFVVLITFSLIHFVLISHWLRTWQFNFHFVFSICAFSSISFHVDK